MTSCLKGSALIRLATRSRNAVVERRQAPGLVAAGKHVVEPLTVDHQVNGRAAQLHAGRCGNGVEDGRIGCVVIHAEGSDVLAAVVTAHGKPAFEQHDQVATARFDDIAGGTRRHAGTFDQAGDGIVGEVREQARALEL